MSILNRFCKSVDAINDWIGRMLSPLVLIISALLLMESIRRYLFNSPTVWASELTQMLFGAYGILAGGYVLFLDSHVKVDIFSSHLPKKVRTLLDIITSSLFFLFSGVLIYFGTSMALDSLSIWEHSNSAWNPPVYPIKMMIPIGALLIFLQGIVKLVREITSLTEREDAQPAGLDKGNSYER
jgi:TRAP-type mannitol/chloroaromatic compound transport system permease small subunit